MLKILIVCDDERLARLEEQLRKMDQLQIQLAGNRERALEVMAREKFDVVAVAETVAGVGGESIVREIVKISPMANCCLSSALSAEGFHEATEGLGIFMQLPLQPGPETAKEMIALLEKIAVISARVEGA